MERGGLTDFLLPKQSKHMLPEKRWSETDGFSGECRKLIGYSEAEGNGSKKEAEAPS